MEISLSRKLLSSISLFRSLSSSNAVKADPVQRCHQRIDEILEHLKPVFEEVVDSELASDEELSKVAEDLNAAISEAREFIENWHQMTSKIYSVMQIESVMTRLRKSAHETLQLLNSLYSADEVSSTATSIERCIENIEQMQHEQISHFIKEAIRDQLDKTVPRPEHLEKISTSLSLSSNRELLMEAVSLDKLKAKVGRSENHAELESINQMIALINYMHECHVKIKQLHSINGVPIPADFCCPLSLELMSDPVIVASGQTYERAFIKQWLDQGVIVCPKTCQTLSHTNLIPNYTVKALIANWCESNGIKIPDPIKSMSLNLPPVFLSSADSKPNAGNIHSDHSPTGNLSRSPDRLSIGPVSSNGIHQENHKPEKSTSPRHLVSSGAPLRSTVNRFEANTSKTPLLNSDGKKEASSEGSQTSNQLNQDLSQNQKADEHVQSHSQSASSSAPISNNGNLHGTGDADLGSQVSSDHYSSDTSGEVPRDAPATSVPPREPDFPPKFSEARSRSQSIWRRPSERFVPRIISSPSMESRHDLSGVETQVRKLIEDLKSDSEDVQRDATAELRLLAKHNMENRIVISNCGAISLLVGLLRSIDLKTQENAVTALLNLSINDNNKTAIANADAIDPLIHVLETGNPEAKENSAATLFSLSVIEENKVKIGRSRAIKPLVELLGNGTPRGKKDAATALFNLSIFHENKARIVQAGAVRHLVDLMDPAAGMVDKAVAVLANLATIPEGRTAIGNEGGIPVLVEVVELGSARGKENAAAVLLQLCTNSNRFCSLVLQEGAVPPLVALSQSGTARAKEKAQALLSYFRNQRHGGAGRP